MKVWILLLVSCISFAAFSAEKIPPQVELANLYRSDIRISDYLVSEKFDGVRAIWNGTNLVTKSGAVIAAPNWFTVNLSTKPLDGELWAGYGLFEFVSAVVRTKHAQSKDWRRVKYLVFDTPNSQLTFIERYQNYLYEIARISSSHVQAVKQWRFEHVEELDDFYKDVLARGGEGVMLHQKNALHIAGRSDRILKYKPFQDAEAIVLGYTEGKGKYKGMMGALRVRNEQGVEFKIGSGFSDAQRQNPPSIGAQITYRHQGATKYGKPRFARFLRERPKL